MLCGPFEHQGQCTVRQLSLDDFQGTDIDLSLVLRLQRMEMWRSMVSPEHLNQDPIECADCRQLFSPREPQKPLTAQNDDITFISTGQNQGQGTGGASRLQTMARRQSAGGVRPFPITNSRGAASPGLESKKEGQNRMQGLFLGVFFVVFAWEQRPWFGPTPIPTWGLPSG